MKPIIEANLNNKTGYERIDEIFGIETMGKLGSYFGNAINKSRQLNQLRRQNDMVERYKTRQANQEAMKRNWELSNQNPQMFVNGDYSRGAAQMRGEFAGQRENNMKANRDNMKADQTATEYERNAAKNIYADYTPEQVDRFNGHLPEQGEQPAGNNNPGGDNGAVNAGGEEQPQQINQMLNNINKILTDNGIPPQVQKQVAGIIQGGASKGGRQNGRGKGQRRRSTTPKTPANPAAPAAGATQPGNQAPGQPAAPAAGAAQPGNQAPGQPAAPATGAARPEDQAPKQPVTQSFERTIPNGLSAIIEDVLSNFN